MKDLVSRLHQGIPLPTQRAHRDRRPNSLALIAPVEDDMRQAARLLHEAHLIIKGLISDAPTFAHREAALNWTRKHS